MDAKSNGAMTRRERLQAMADALRTARPYIKDRRQPYICWALRWTYHPGWRDARALVERALDGHLSLEAWHYSRRGNDPSRAAMRSARLRWIDQLVGDIEAEIARGEQP